MQSKRALLGVIAHRTILDQVYQALDDAILAGRLESNGLLVTRAHRDTHVVSLDGADMSDLHSVRAVLEGYAAVSALATLRAHHLAPMERELEVLDNAARDWDRVAVLDARWHSHITAAAANKRLATLRTNSKGPLRVLFARLARVVYRPEQFLQRHAARLDVRRAGDLWDIEHAIREHYLSSAQRLTTQVDHGSDQPHGSGKERSPDTSIRTGSRGAPAPAAHAIHTND